jgi:hypothetical protein
MIVANNSFKINKRAYFIVTEENNYNVRMFDGHGLELPYWLFESESKVECEAVKNFLNRQTDEVIKAIVKSKRKA